MIESPTLIDEEQDAPDWWAEVQQDRDDLLGTDRLESWLDEDVDFLPRRRFVRTVEIDDTLVDPADEPQAGPVRRFPRTRSESRVLEALGELGDDVELATEAPPRERTGSFDVVIGEDGTLTTSEILPASPELVDEIVMAVPASSERPTVRITGNPQISGQGGALRRRDRSLMEMIGPHPDRIAFWVVLLGVALILLSLLSS